jgi:hypothetical protein
MPIRIMTLELFRRTKIKGQKGGGKTDRTSQTLIIVVKQADPIGDLSSARIAG